MPGTTAAAAPRAPVLEQRVDAVVVGAGFAGLYMVQRLRAAGMTVQGVEAAADVGGTWYWNRYPGARCDIPSLMYSYTWSDDLRETWRWSEKYATQPEILRYAETVADRYDLRDAYLFETRVTSATFDETQARWRVETDRGDRLVADFLIMATGCLSVPRLPDIAGADSFAGESHVTGRWPHAGVDFAGKRVALIGTGSSAIQSLPLIAADAAQVHVFQRTANFSVPALNRALDEEEVAEFDANFAWYRDTIRKGESIFELPPPEWVPSDAELADLVALLWDGNGLVSSRLIPNLLADQRTNDAAADFVRARIAEIVADPATAATLMPKDFPIAAKRMCIDTDYYATFNRANVALVDLNTTPIVAITPQGVRTSDADYPVDVIVYALGFDAMTGALTQVDIRGRGGVLLRDLWVEGPKTYLGVAVAGFPNLFTVTGPGSPSVLTNMIFSAEQHVDWIMRAIGHVRAQGNRVIEAREDAQDDWTGHVDREAEKTLYPRAPSWYRGDNVPGKPRRFMPYVAEDYAQRIAAEAEAGYPGFHISGAAA